MTPPPSLAKGRAPPAPSLPAAPGSFVRSGVPEPGARQPRRSPAQAARLARPGPAQLTQRNPAGPDRSSPGPPPGQAAPPAPFPPRRRRGGRGPRALTCWTELFSGTANSSFSFGVFTVTFMILGSAGPPSAALSCTPGGPPLSALSAMAVTQASATLGGCGRVREARQAAGPPRVRRRGLRVQARVGDRLPGGRGGLSVSPPLPPPAPPPRSSPAPRRARWVTRWPQRRLQAVGCARHAG